MRRFLAVFWIVACLFILAWSLYRLTALGPNDQWAFEITALHLIAIVLLNFPCGAIALSIQLVVSSSMIADIGGSLGLSVYIVEVLFVWGVAVIAGYLQWFKLVPWLYSRLTRKGAL